MSAKGPNPIDIEVGRRVRARRTQMRMPQEGLGHRLGITFQQVQKYEKGTNRISAGRLQQIADILQVPVAFFFGPMAGVVPENQAILGFLNAAHSLRLIKAYARIGDRNIQQSVVSLVEHIADHVDRPKRRSQ